MKKIFLCLLLFIVSCSSVGKATPVQWKTEDGSNGHFYEAVSVPEGISWTDAKTAAELAGGYLATITSEPENAFVFSLIDDASFWKPGVGGPWLGGYQPEGSPEPDGGWRWVTDNESFDYTHWAPGEPSDSHRIENRLHYFYYPDSVRSSYWNDTIDDAGLIGYVVEVPEPATLLLFGLGGLVAIRRRKR